MVVPIQPGMMHAVRCVCDIHPSVGKWKTLTGEGGFGMRAGVVDLAMTGARERDRAVRRFVMEFVQWRSEEEGGSV